MGSYLFYNSSLKNVPGSSKVEEKINYNASFIIFTNGTFRDFTDSKYHNRSEDVYITSENPNVIYIKNKGVIWDDFFKTLPSPMELNKDCLTTGTGQRFCTNEEGTLKFYLNGKSDNDFLSKPMKDRDQALITYGNESKEEIENQMEKIPKIP